MPTTFERPSLISGASNGSGSVSGSIDPDGKGNIADVICGFRPTVVLVEEDADPDFSVAIKLWSADVSISDTGISQVSCITFTDNGFQYTQQYRHPNQIHYTAMP